MDCWYCIVDSIGFARWLTSDAGDEGHDADSVVGFSAVFDETSPAGTACPSQCHRLSY